MSLSGKIFSKYYVVVSGHHGVKRLDQLGSYGTQTQSLRGKGPLDRQLTRLDIGPLAEISTILSLHEAYHLQQRSCLSIKSEDTDQYLTRDLCWALFSDRHKNFPLEYAVFRYFRSRNWIVRSGYNYGTEFLLYRSSRVHDHARYVVMIMPEKNSYGWQSLLTANRVVQSVKKDLLLCYVKLSPGYDAKDPECIDVITISCYKFLAHPNVAVLEEPNEKDNTCPDVSGSRDEV